MKKNLKTVLVLAVIAVLVGINVYNSQSETDMSDVALANVEALADGEDGSWIMECGFHGCIIDFSWDCLYPVGSFWGYCPNMRGA